MQLSLLSITIPIGVLGLILNFTKRNWLLRSSRLLGTFDLAENPKGKINYFYYTGNKSRWWHHTEVYAERLLMNAYIEGTPHS
jgi:NTE family protein